MAVIVIRSAPCDAETGAALAEALRERGLDAFYWGGNGEGAYQETEPADGPFPGEKDGPRRAVIVLWSRAALAAEDQTLLDAGVKALCRDELVLATVDAGGDPDTCLPQGFRTLPSVDIAKWRKKGTLAPLRELERAAQAVASRDPFEIPEPVRRMTRRAELWNGVAVASGGLISLAVMAAIAGSGFIGEQPGTLDWAELVLAKGPAGWVPVAVALAAAVGSGVAAWLGAIGMFAALGLLSIRNGDQDFPLGQDIQDVAVIHAPENAQEAEYLVMDIERLGMTVSVDPAHGDEDPAWASASARAIDRCDLVVLMGTASAFRSEHVRRCIVTAGQLGRPIVPLLLEKTDIPKDLRRWISARSWIEVSDRVGGLLVPKVQNALYSLLQRPALLSGAGR